MADYLWYAAFGSNLSYARFEKYLVGGSAALASDAPERGARDTSPPIDEDTLEVPHEVYFAWQADKWDGGGVAFLSAEQSETTTICRLHKITVGQFEDVHMQESRGAHPVALDLEELSANGSLMQYDGSLYGLALLLGIHDDGCPIVTLTTNRTDLVPNCPSVGYAATIASGLVEFTDMTPVSATDYVMAKRGVDHRLDRAELERIVIEQGQ